MKQFMLQFELGIAVFLLSLVVCSIMTFLRSLQVEEMAMTSKPCKVDTIECCNFFIFFLCCIKNEFFFCLFMCIYTHIHIKFAFASSFCWPISLYYLKFIGIVSEFLAFLCLIEHLFFSFSMVLLLGCSVLVLDCCFPS